MTLAGEKSKFWTIFEDSGHSFRTCMDARDGVWYTPHASHRSSNVSNATLMSNEFIPLTSHLCQIRLCSTQTHKPRVRRLKSNKKKTHVILSREKRMDLMLGFERRRLSPVVCISPAISVRQSRKEIVGRREAYCALFKEVQLFSR